MSDPPYSMTIDLNVLNHLGINLYSNNPAVLAEAVANAWDADAEHVEIDIDPSEGTILITDDGHGMTAEDINAKFLRVGRRRREDGESSTPRFKRPVMGRKGIGKLSLFSIADTIEVQSSKDGQQSGFTMSLKEIEQVIDDETSGGIYHPKPLPEDQITVTSGTRITLSKMRRQLSRTETNLRRRLARRFSIIGSQHDFSITINGTPVGIEDRDYYSMLQFAWCYGRRGKEASRLCSSECHVESRAAQTFQGWIGTVDKPSQLTDGGASLNNIVLMARGKLIQEDVLEFTTEAGFFSKYIIGELEADQLDVDDADDIATTNRQAVVEEDPRVQALRLEVVRELAHIRSAWTEQRNKAGRKVALENPAIKAWFGELGKDEKRRAERVFGKINEITTDDPDQRALLFTYGVFAFEHMKAKRNLDALEEASGEVLVEFGKVFTDQDDLEASLYHQIVKSRLLVIKALRQRVEDDALEKVIQRHLFEHLWLLDPSWERATGSEYMERKVSTEFKEVDRTFGDRDLGRVDIKYRTSAGTHVIIELKRASVLTETADLLKQVDKYRVTLRRLLTNAGYEHPQIDTVCVVGRDLRDWEEPGGKQESVESLARKNIRVVTYSQLITKAEAAYRDFLDENRKAGRIVRLLSAITSDA